MSFSRLLEPAQIRNVKLRNRIVCPAHSRYFADEDGSVNDVVLATYEALARGGVGLIVMEMSAIDFPQGAAVRHLVIADDRFIPGLTRLSEVVHRHGCPTFLQLSHSGPSQPAKNYGFPPVSSSSLEGGDKPMPGYDTARELSIAEIRDIVTRFADGAERARKAGFDGVEIHGAHTYLVNSFLSPAWNKRQDDYGNQTLENRARFAVEIIRAIKERNGENFPVGIRVNGREWGVAGGITGEESREIARLLVAAGADYISVSGYGFGPYSWIHYPEQVLYPEPARELIPLVPQIKKPGILVPPASEIKKAVPVPVFAVGRLDPELGEWLLRHDMADFIGMVRRLMADPELPNKVAEGRLDEIRKCLGCVECTGKVALKEPVRCRVNASLGRETEYLIRPAEKKKKVLVVGGGPGGMEATRVAALRGHEVTLYEKSSRLGGLLPLAAMIKGFQVEDLTQAAPYFETQFRKLGVRLKLGTEASPALIQTARPDAVIIAAGGLPALPGIPGIETGNLAGTAELHAMVKPLLRLLGPRLLRRLTRFWIPAGKRVVIIGGQIAGCQLAEFMVKRGRQVTVLETGGELGTGLPERNRQKLLSWLKSKGAVLMTGISFENIRGKTLTLVTGEGKRQVMEADTIFSAVPFRPNLELYEAIRDKVPEVHLVGDCAEAGKIIDAIDDGVRTGCQI